MSNTPTRIGLMGCGMVAHYGHLPAILATPGLQLHAVFDPNQDNLRRTQEQFGVAHGFTDAEAFFRSGITGVSITSPAPCHRDNVLKAAAHRISVLCEKPLAMNSVEGADMIGTMRAAGVPLYSAFCYRFSPCSLKIRELVRDRVIGDVRSLRLIYNWALHGKFTTDAEGRRIIQKRREDRMLEGGPMIDCGTHQIDLAGFWLDSPVRSFSAQGAWVDDYDAPDHMWLHLDHASGAHTVIEISYSYHHTSLNRRSEFTYELIGTEGVIRYNREARSFTAETAAGLQTYEFAPEKNFEGLYAEWSHALATGSSELLTTAEDGLRVVEIAREATDAVIAARKR
ncbi:MAG: Gfo/Idh/MocA family oxidoreductase [Rariglobus sp.]